MSKVLTITEVAEVVANALLKHSDTPWERGQANANKAYESFLMDLGQLLESNFGGEFLNFSEPIDDGLGFALLFRWNESVPEDGGIYANYDKDINMEEWRRESSSKLSIACHLRMD